MSGIMHALAPSIQTLYQKMAARDRTLCKISSLAYEHKVLTRSHWCIVKFSARWTLSGLSRKEKTGQLQQDHCTDLRAEGQPGTQAKTHCIRGGWKGQSRRKGPDAGTEKVLVA